jgi:hypothetical protein
MGFLTAQQLHSRQVTSRLVRREMAPDCVAVAKMRQLVIWTYAYL